MCGVLQRQPRVEESEEKDQIKAEAQAEAQAQKDNLYKTQKRWCAELSCRLIERVRVSRKRNLLSQVELHPPGLGLNHRFQIKKSDRC